MIKNLTPEITQKILEIGNCGSVSRIARIFKCLHGEEIHLNLIYSVLQENNINYPQGHPNNNYIDSYTILFEAKSFWKSYRRIYGDNEAKKLVKFIKVNPNFRSLYNQFHLAIAEKLERKVIDYLHKDETKLLLEENFSVLEIKQQYLYACDLCFDHDPKVRQGQKNPIYQKVANIQTLSGQYPTPQLSGISLETVEDCIAYFATFWRTLLANRGKYYVQNLHRLVSDTSNSIYPKIPYYSLTKDNTLTFLAALESFKNGADFYIETTPEIVKACPKKFKDLVDREGYENVISLCVLGYIVNKKKLEH